VENVAKIFDRSPSPDEVNRQWSSSLCATHNKADLETQPQRSPFVVPRDRSKESVTPVISADPTKNHFPERSTTTPFELTERMFGRDVLMTPEEKAQQQALIAPRRAMWNHLKLAQSNSGQMILLLQDEDEEEDEQRWPPLESEPIRRDRIFSARDQLGCQTIMFEKLDRPVRTRSATPNAGERRGAGLSRMDSLRSARGGSKEVSVVQCA